MPSLLQLQRRHGPQCAAGHLKGSYTFESDERRRQAKHCDCRIYASGTLAGVFMRYATKQREWSRAKEVIAPYLAAGRWDIDPDDPGPGPAGRPFIPPPDSPAGTPIRQAVEEFLEEHRANHSAPNTIKRYREVLEGLVRYSDSLGLRTLQEWRPKTVRDLRASWQNAPYTKRKKLGVIKTGRRAPGRPSQARAGRSRLDLYRRRSGGFYAGLLLHRPADLRCGGV